MSQRSTNAISPSPVPTGEGAGGEGSLQLDLYDIIADIDADLESDLPRPVRIRAWQKAPAVVSGLEDTTPVYVLHVTHDALEYKEITIACPEGWTAEDSDAGTVYLLDPAGVAHLCHIAVKNGLVKIADVAAFPSVAATRAAKEIAK